MNAAEILFTNDVITITRHADPAYLHAEWRGYQTMQSIQDGFNRLLTCMFATRTFSILNDHREQKGIWIDAAEWVATQWFPRMRLAGMRRFAWIYGEARFSQVSIDAVLAGMDAESYGVRVFFDGGEAVEWLLQGEVD